jgi:hypothetical protein
VPAAYTVSIDRTTLPATVAGQTVDPDDVLDSRHAITLAAGDNVAAVDFAYEPSVAAPAAVPNETPVVAPAPAPAPAPAGPVGLPVTGAALLAMLALAGTCLTGGALLRVTARRRAAGSDT